MEHAKYPEGAGNRSLTFAAPRIKHRPSRERQRAVAGVIIHIAISDTTLVVLIQYLSDGFLAGYNADGECRGRDGAPGPDADRNGGLGKKLTVFG